MSLPPPPHQHPHPPHPELSLLSLHAPSSAPNPKGKGAGVVPSQLVGGPHDILEDSWGFGDGRPEPPTMPTVQPSMDTAECLTLLALNRMRGNSHNFSGGNTAKGDGEDARGVTKCKYVSFGVVLGSEPLRSVKWRIQEKVSVFVEAASPCFPTFPHEEGCVVKKAAGKRCNSTR